MEPGPKSNVVRRAALGSVVLLLALVAYLRFGPGHAAEPSTPIPDYTASVAALHVRAGNEPFEIVVRPGAPAPRVVAYAFGIGEQEPNPIDATIELLPDGSIRIRGAARALAGARAARVVVGTASADSIRRFDDAVARARDGRSDASIRVLTVPIVRD